MWTECCRNLLRAKVLALRTLTCCQTRIAECHHCRGTGASFDLVGARLDMRLRALFLEIVPYCETLVSSINRGQRLGKRPSGSRTSIFPIQAAHPQILDCQLGFANSNGSRHLLVAQTHLLELWYITDDQRHSRAQTHVGIAEEGQPFTHTRHKGIFSTSRSAHSPPRNRHLLHPQLRMSPAKFNVLLFPASAARSS